MLQIFACHGLLSGEKENSLTIAYLSRQQMLLNTDHKVEKLHSSMESLNIRIS